MTSQIEIDGDVVDQKRQRNFEREADVAFAVRKIGDGKYEGQNGDGSKTEDDSGNVRHVPIVGETGISPGTNDMDTLDKEEVNDDLVDHIKYQAQDDGGEACLWCSDLIAKSQRRNSDDEANSPEVNCD